MPEIKSNSPDQGTNVVAGDAPLTVYLVDATMTVKKGRAVITKSSAIALTLPAPVAGLPTDATPGDDGRMLEFISTTAAAHVVTCAQGFNGKGSSGTATLGAAKGNGFRIMAYGGQWYNAGNTGCTYA